MVFYPLAMNHTAVPDSSRYPALAIPYTRNTYDAHCCVSVPPTLSCADDNEAQVASPVSFLLWCLGLDRWRDRNPSNLLRGNRGNPPPLTRGRVGALRRRGYYEGEGEGSEQFLELQHGGAAGSRSARVAKLGERGRRSAFDQFRQLQRDGACCDVTLAVGGRTFKAHK